GCSSARPGTTPSTRWRAWSCTSFRSAPGRRSRRPRREKGSDPLFFQEALERAPQQLELSVHRTAAVTDQEVRLQRRPLGDGKVAVLFLRHELGGALAREVHLPNQFFSRHM